MEMLLNAFFTPICVSCGSYGSTLCYSCRNSLPLLDEQRCLVCDSKCIEGNTHPLCKRDLNVKNLLSPYMYSGVTRDIIRSSKFGSKAFATLKVLAYEGGVTVKKWGYVFEGYTIIPVPLSKKRSKSRGFNQSEFIANELAKVFLIPVETSLLFRRKNTVFQSELNKQERKKNVENAFSVNTKRIGNLPNRALLVDDISTTGATLLSASKTLLSAGIKEVSCFALSKKI